MSLVQNNKSNKKSVTPITSRKELVLTENAILKLENKKLKDDIEKYQSRIAQLEQSVIYLQNKLNKKSPSGRKQRFTDQEKEIIKMYRMQGKTIRWIASFYSCSVGLIDKIIKE